MQIYPFPDNVDKLMPDFFLDAPPDSRMTANLPKENQPTQKSAAAGGSDVDKIFNAIESNLSPELVQKTQASFQFKIKTPGKCHLKKTIIIILKINIFVK